MTPQEWTRSLNETYAAPHIVTEERHMALKTIRADAQAMQSRPENKSGGVRTSAIRHSRTVRVSYAVAASVLAMIIVFSVVFITNPFDMTNHRSYNTTPTRENIKLADDMLKDQLDKTARMIAEDEEEFEEWHTASSTTGEEQHAIEQELSALKKLQNHYTAILDNPNVHPVNKVLAAAELEAELRALSAT